jgi:hypothetical protein
MVKERSGVSRMLLLEKMVEALSEHVRAGVSLWPFELAI